MYEWSVVSVIYEYLHNVNSRRYHWHNRGIIEEKCKAVGVYLVRNLLMMMYRISFNVCRTPYFDETTKSHSEISCVAKFCSSFDTFSVNEKLEIKGLFNLCLRTHSKYPSTNHSPYSNTSHNFFNQKICKYMVSFFARIEFSSLLRKSGK